MIKAGIHEPSFLPITMSEQPSQRIATRTSNANKHPGEQIPKRKRRTQAEMQEFRKSQEEAKEAKRIAQQEKIGRIATLENKMAEEDIEVKNPAR
jgi:hypothetical protein